MSVPLSKGMTINLVEGLQVLANTHQSILEIKE